MFGLELRGFESLGENYYCNLVEIQSCNFDLDLRPVYGLTKVGCKFEQTCLASRSSADPDLIFF